MFLKTVFGSCCSRLNRPNFFNSLIFFPLVLWSVSSSTTMPQLGCCSLDQASLILTRPEEFWKPCRPIFVIKACLFIGTSLLCICSVCDPALQYWDPTQLLQHYSICLLNHKLLIAFQPIMYLPILPKLCFPCLYLGRGLKTLSMSQRRCSMSTCRRGEQIPTVRLRGERPSM